jgi:hypothetical protein
MLCSGEPPTADILMTRLTFELSDDAARQLDEAAELQRTSRSDVIRDAVQAWIQPCGDTDDLYTLTDGLSHLQLVKLTGYLCGSAKHVPPVAVAMRRALASIGGSK